MPVQVRRWIADAEAHGVEFPVLARRPLHFPFGCSPSEQAAVLVHAALQSASSTGWNASMWVRYARQPPVAEQPCQLQCAMELLEPCLQALIPIGTRGVAQHVLCTLGDADHDFIEVEGVHVRLSGLA
jgi:hypothetical protein